MTSRERMEAALRGEQPDTVPIFLRDLTLGLDVCHFTTPEVCAGGPGGGYDGEKSARCVIETHRLLGHDCVVGSIHDLAIDADLLGGRVEFPERGIPRVATPPFATANAVANARLPDLHTEGRMPGLLRSYRIVDRAIGDEVAIAANVEGPLTKVGLLRGLEGLIEDLVTNPSATRAAADFAAELACEHVRALLDAGAHFVFVAAASDGPAVIRPEHYLEYSIPGLRKIVAAARGRGAPVVFHPHGPFTEQPFWPLVEAAIQTGITGFQFGENNDLSVARRLWGKRVCILGGVDIPTTLALGPPERIQEVTRNVIGQAGREGGFVLMPSCSVHRGLPIKHLQAMIQAARG
jgi:MtaA/CmuA family methyltransferase